MDDNNHTLPNSDGILDDALLAARAKNRSSYVKLPANIVIFEVIELFAAAFLVFILMCTFLIRLVTVNGDSMNYTLYDSDRLFISNTLYAPKSGDIVVIQVPQAEKQPPLIKRIIATEGQVIDIDFATWQVTVDGQIIDEPYINRVEASMLNLGAYTYPHTVGEGMAFVMGDNRNYSRDSRSSDIGEIDYRNIVGKVIVRVFPFDRIGKV